MSDKVLENRVRRMAERYGMKLRKSARRDPAAPDFNGYMLLDGKTDRPVFGMKPRPFSARLAEIAAHLTSRHQTPPATILKMLEMWLSEAPERIASCGLATTDPRAAALALMDGEEADKRLLASARRLVTIVEDAGGIHSPAGRVVLAALRPVADGS